MRQRSSTAGDVADLLLETLRLDDAADAAALERRWAALNHAGLPGLTEYEGCELWLYRRLRELRLFDVVPALFGQWLATRAHQLTARNLLVDAQRDDLVRILNDLRVPHVLLKGAALRLVADRYPYVDARTTSDVDVLLPKDLALPTWERLCGAGFHPASRQAADYDRHFHLPPLQNGRAVNVELHTSTSNDLTDPLAWHRFDQSARVVHCKTGPTRVPAATELLWHAITHTPLPDPYAFRIRFFQDATVCSAAGEEVDWSEIATRLASTEIRHNALTRRWLGTAAGLTGLSATPGPLGALPAFDFAGALRWRVTVFGVLAVREGRRARPVWGPHAVSRGRRLLIDQGTRAEFGLPPSPPPPNTPPLRHAGRRVAAAAARLSYRAWRLSRRA